MDLVDVVASLADRVRGAAEDQQRGRVRVTAPPWLAERFLIPGLAELKERYPDLESELNGTNRIVNLAQREADLALRNERPKQKSFVVRKVAELGGCVYASKLYLERRGTPRSRRDLAKHDVLVYETLGGMPGFEWMREPGTGACIAFRASDPVALVGAATAGLGLAAVPCMLGDPEPSLQRVESLELKRCDSFLVMPETLRQAARVRAAAEFVVEQLRRNRAALLG